MLILPNRAWGEHFIDRQDIMQELCGDSIRHQCGPLCLQKEQLRCDVLWEQGGQETERLGGVGLTRALVQAGVVDRNGTKDRLELHGVILLTTPRLAAARAGMLRLKICRHLLRHHDLLQGLEDGFAFGEGEVQGGGGEVPPLQAGDLPRLGPALICLVTT